MKFRFFFSICITLLPLSAFAQSLVLPDRLWSNTSYVVAPGASYATNWIKFEGDTTIADTLYTKVYRSDSELQDDWYPYGAILEDTSQKVFLHRDNSKHLLYDFKLDKGDSILSSFGHYVYVADTYNVYLESFGDSLKRIDFSFVKDGGLVEGNWIEGVGSSYGILEGANPVGLVGGASALVCLMESGNLMYSNDQFDNCFPSGYVNTEDIIYEKPDIKLSISSNHVAFSFDGFPKVNTSLSIVDISGRQILKEDITGRNQITIPRSHFNSGIYIYSFIVSDEQISGKFAIP